jgi:vancomycin resistance protein YoaR
LAKSKGLKVLILSLFVLALVGTGAFWYVYKPNYSEDKIFPGVRVVGTDTGGMSKDEVSRLLSRKINSYNDSPVILTYKEQKFRLYPKEVNFRFNIEELTAKAIAVGRNGSFQQRFAERWQAMSQGVQIAPDFKVSNGKISKYVLHIARIINTSPRNATYLVKENNVKLVPETNGQEVNIQENVGRVEKALLREGDRQVPLAVTEKKPPVTSQTYESMGIQGVVASFTTSFQASQPSRKHNIKVASQAFNNIIIKPNDNFSFNKIIKEKKIDRLYKVAKIIKNNKFVLGDGGGVCQVSTTLYNTVLKANLKIIERAHHSMPVAYVPLGQDATVSEGAVDLIFKNDTNKSILLLTDVNNKRLTFYLLGQSSANEGEVRINSVLIKKDKQATIKFMDRSMPRGVVKTENGSPFYEVKVYREVYRNSKIVAKELISHDKYKKVANEIRIGTANPWEMPDQ